MDIEREKRLADLLLAALEQPEEKQLVFLQSACRDDLDLLAEAQLCLARQGELDEVLERPVGGLFLAPSDFSATGAIRRPGLDADASTVPFGAPDGHEAAPTLDDANTWQNPLGFSRLGLYRLVGLLGKGGMGQVYIGEDERLGRQIAVKILPPDMAQRAGRLERFEREARALAALNHPNIVTIHSIEEDRGIRFLTMERVEGRTLKERLAEGELPVSEILDLAIDMTSALAAAHGRGVIHRDLKPANIMLTEDDRIKILDFGVAKLTSPGSGRRVTRDGMVLGTVAYMSPEQLHGLAIDERSDLFSVGVLLFLMASGQHPFPADRQMQRISAILEKPPTDLRTLREDLDGELVTLIYRCLEKDPAHRPQSAEILHAELRELREAHLARQILESRLNLQAGSETNAGSNPTRRDLFLIAIVLVLLLLGFATFRQRSAITSNKAVVPGEKAARLNADEPKALPTLAILPFNNLNDDPQLAWLAEGIAELLATDLAQSAGLSIIGSPALQRLMTEIEIDPNTPLDPVVARQLAERGKIQFVVRGNYARFDDLLHVACVLENPLEGQILHSAAFEGQGTSSLFRLVGQLGSSVLNEVGVERPELGPDTLEQATTSSLAAWRAYTEGQQLYLKHTQTEAAIVKMKEALAIDPNFALAAATASKMHQSLGRSAEAQAYSLRAFEQVDHLPLRTRFVVEAGHYGTRWTTLGRAIETYALAVKVYPEQVGWWNNLARRYAFFERYGEAREAFEQAIAQGSGYWGNVYGLANLDAAENAYDRGYLRFQNALEANPDHWMLRYAMAWHLTEWGRFDQADEQLNELAAERPQVLRIPYARWRLALLREDLDRADREARLLLLIDDPFARWRGHVALAQNSLFRGLASTALEHFADAIGASTGADRALARCFKAELHLRLGDASAALQETTQARMDGAGQWPELAAMALEARAEERLGRSLAADALLQNLRNHWRQQPNAVEERQLLRLVAFLARARGEVAEEHRALERAVALLPERGVEFSWHVFPDHVPLLVELGEAELVAGRARQALPWLRRARQLGAERLEHPVAYVRGLYLGAEAEEEAGSAEKARALRQRFRDFWASSDLEPQGLRP